MANTELGTAVIVYEDPEEGTVERTVQNERIAYFQDHWIVKLDEDEAGNDVVRRIPLQRVHYVERSVEAFEEEVGTLRSQVESFAEDLRSTLLGRREEPAAEGGVGAAPDRGEPERIEIDDHESSDTDR